MGRGVRGGGLRTKLFGNLVDGELRHDDLGRTYRDEFRFLPYVFVVPLPVLGTRRHHSDIHGRKSFENPQLRPRSLRDDLRRAHGRPRRSGLIGPFDPHRLRPGHGHRVVERPFEVLARFRVFLTVRNLFRMRRERHALRAEPWNPSGSEPHSRHREFVRILENPRRGTNYCGLLRHERRIHGLRFVPDVPLSIGMSVSRVREREDVSRSHRHRALTERFGIPAFGNRAFRVFAPFGEFEEIRRAPFEPQGREGRQYPHPLRLLIVSRVSGGRNAFRMDRHLRSDGGSRRRFSARARMGVRRRA